MNINNNLKVYEACEKFIQTSSGKYLFSDIRLLLYFLIKTIRFIYNYGLK